MSLFTDLAHDVLIGTVAGVGAEKVRERIDNGGNRTNPYQEAEDKYAPVLGLIKETLVTLKNIEGALTHAGTTDIDLTLLIPVYPSSISLLRFGKNHTMLFLKAPQALWFDDPQIGQFTTPAALPFGWNQIDLSEGTRVAVPQGGVILLAHYRASDNPVGAMI